MVVGLRLPDKTKLATSSAPLVCRKLRIKRLAGLSLGPNNGIAKRVAISPDIIALLHRGAHVRLHGPGLSLDSTGLDTLLANGAFRLMPNSNRPHGRFIIIPNRGTLLRRPSILALALATPRDCNVSTNRPLVLRNIRMNRIVSHGLADGNIAFAITVRPRRQRLMGNSDGFIIGDHISIGIKLSNIRFLNTDTSR